MIRACDFLHSYHIIKCVKIWKTDISSATQSFQITQDMNKSYKSEKLESTLRFTETELRDLVSDPTMHLTFKFKTTTKWGSVEAGAERSTISAAASQTGFPDTLSAWSYVFPSHNRLDERHQEDPAAFHRWEVCKCVLTSGGGANYLYKYL